MSSVVDQTPFNEYPSVDGVATVFPYEFQLLSASDLIVYVNGIEVASSTFTISGVGVQEGGDITFLSAPPAGSAVLLVRFIGLSRDTDYQYNGDLREATLDRDFNRIWQALQGIEAQLGGVIRLPYPEQVVELPGPVDRKGKLIGFDAVTGAVVLVTNTLGSIGDFALQLASAGGSALVGFLQRGTGAIPRTMQAKSQDRCCVFDFMTATQIAAVRAGLGGPDAIVDAAIQKAMDSGYANIWLPIGLYLLSKPLYHRVGGTQNLTLEGESKVATLIQPAAINIADATVGVNSLIINQNNDGKFSLKHLRFQSDLAYTGNVLYCKEGGGLDGSVQSLFSGEILDCWFSLATPNTGILRGGFQNCKIRGNTCENAKGFILLEGPGTYDLMVTENAIFRCYDGFIETLDTIERRVVRVLGVNCTNHLRGPLIKASNAVGWEISGIAATGDDATPPTNFGLFEFTNCRDMLISDFGLESVAPYGLAADAIVLSGTSARFSSGIIRGAEYGVTINGTAPIDVEFANLDILSARTSFMRTTAALPGRIVKIGGTWKDAHGSGIANIVAAGALDIWLRGGRLLNAGLGGAAGTRLVDLSSAGSVRLDGVEYGRDNLSAAAAYFFQGSNSVGEWVVSNCRRIGTAPTADNIGFQPMKFGSVEGKAGVYFSSISPATGRWVRGDTVRNDTPTVGQPKAWTCTVAGAASSTTRADSTVYAANVWAKWPTGTTVWEVTTAGTSAASAPSIVGKVVGDTVVDGTVTWTMRSLTTATFVSEGNL